MSCCSVNNKECSSAGGSICLFDDLEKSVTDLLDKDYVFGAVHVKAQAKRSNGLVLNSELKQNLDTQTAVCSVGAKYTIDDSVEIQPKWESNVSSLENLLVIRDGLVKGLELKFNTRLSLVTMFRSASVQFAYKMPHVVVDGTVDLLGVMDMKLRCLVRRGPLVLGSKVHFECSDVSKTYSVGGAYCGKDFCLTAKLLESRTVVLSYFRKVSEKLQFGAKLDYTLLRDGASPRACLKHGAITVGAVYKMDESTTIRARISDTLNSSIGVTHLLRPGLKVGLSANINTRDISKPVCNPGLSLELELD